MVGFIVSMILIVSLIKLVLGGSVKPIGSWLGGLFKFVGVLILGAVIFVAYIIITVPIPILLLIGMLIILGVSSKC